STTTTGLMSRFGCCQKGAFWLSSAGGEVSVDDRLSDRDLGSCCMGYCSLVEYVDVLEEFSPAF
ncbi:MAG TPA: hypothetical protein PK671_05670, partial [Candidatus Obscuribacter sp.]|nr:hypothetical protein [Candidatus Obscuribacter sp.]